MGSLQDTPYRVGVVYVLRPFLRLGIFLQLLPNEAANHIALLPVHISRLPDRGRGFQAGAPEQGKTLEAPVENSAQVPGLDQFRFQPLILLRVRKVPLEGNDFRALRGKNRIIGHIGKVIGIYKNAKLGAELKAAFMEKTGGNGVISGPRFDK